MPVGEGEPLGDIEAEGVTLAEFDCDAEPEALPVALRVPVGERLRVRVPDCERVRVPDAD